MPSPHVSNYGITTTAASLTLTAAAHAGHTILLTVATTATITLPAATGSGNRYEITNQLDQTGDLVVQVASASDTMQGTAHTDMTGVIFATAATTDTVTLNGTTKGGLKGARVCLQDVASGLWNVTVISESSGTEVTPFSAAV